VDHPGGVRGVEGGGDLGDDGEGALAGERAAPEAGLEGLAVEEFHGEVGAAWW
jgi:hypothetical protein